MRQSVACLGLVFFLSACAHSNSPGGSEAKKLDAVISDYTEAAKRLDPYHASYFNVEEDLGKFGEYPSLELKAREKALIQSAIDRLAKINPDRLSEEERRTYELFKEDVTVSIKGYDFPSELLEFNQMSNRLHSYLDDTSQALTSFPFDSVKHYDDFLKRSEGFPAYVDRQIETFRRGMKEGVTLSCVVAAGAVNSYRAGLEARVTSHPFYRPILFMPKSFPKADRERLAKDYRKMVSERILPGFKKFHAFFTKEYTPRCRKGFGIGSVPRGKEWYAQAIEESTDLRLDPKELHETGLREVARIEAEMEATKRKLNSKGSLKRFQAALKRDPKYTFKSSRELFAAFEKVKAEVARKIPEYFQFIPRSDYRIVSSSNPEDAAASYHNPTENVPYGKFVVNTANLNLVPTYRVKTLSIHEAVPGHHFQLALQFEMKDQLSEYRRKLFFSNAFAEGWALYSEYLGREMGMYEEPLQYFGHLEDEMLRAVRLVVDTGIHAFGWSREKAMGYMRDHLASSEKDISNEVNRYSVWPGQALSYKVGQLKILELRRLAEKELGPLFSIRGFHGAVIGNGTVSLGLLDRQVRDWITVVKKGGGGRF